MQRDITPDIDERMATVQKAIEELNRKRTALEEQLRTEEQRLQALRVVFDWEAAMRGTVVTGKASMGGRNRWLGMGLRDVVQVLVEENPSWDFTKLRDRIIRDGFDFKGKRPGNAVGMALTSLRRKQNSSGEAEG